ncbi:hypothetical protein [Nannocystis punicea]|uniref:NlpC/P60 family protein n=1 Tax=Nannocystis punicea TaxID=2995304 RepID=A0ABY7GZY6_9BACT|nr:hypothetical protein [Nannocystis poenicansa]WAS92435.1 hypothetical protein O0S08_40165 [Nannocystis poenicansa]
MSFWAGCPADSGLAAGAGEAAAVEAPRPAFENTLAAIAGERARLGRRYAATTDPAKRAEIRAEARKYFRDTVVREVFPAWLGMPWGLGKNSTANRPHAPGQTVACGYFVAAVLENAGLELSSRYKYAQAPALTVQKALAPAPADLHRYFSVPAEALAAKIAGLGDGLYIIGLANHIGFAVVDGAEVRLVHASYTGEQVVTDEPLVSAQAIADSRPKGYFVTPVMHDDRLADLWLRGVPVPL